MVTRKPTTGSGTQPGRRAKPLARPHDQARAAKPYAGKDGRHPAWGALKGMIHILPGVDLTEPAFPDWEKDWLEANAWWLDDPKLNPRR